MFVVVSPAAAKQVEKPEERIIEGETYKLLLEGYIRVTKYKSGSVEEFVRDLLKDPRFPQYIGSLNGEYKYFLTLKYLEKQCNLSISYR